MKLLVMKNSHIGLIMSNKGKQEAKSFLRDILIFLLFKFLLQKSLCKELKTLIEVRKKINGYFEVV